MANEKRLIYLEDALKVMPALEMCWRALRSLPTVDAVEVVRCKDCVSGHTQHYGGLFRCNVMGCGGLKADDFCSYGERREGE